MIYTLLSWVTAHLTYKVNHFSNIPPDATKGINIACVGICCSLLSVFVNSFCLLITTALVKDRYFLSLLAGSETPI